MAGVIFIGGFPRSGSTLTGDLVATLFDAVHVGETQHIFNPVFHEKPGCSCGRRLGDCPIWSTAQPLIEVHFPERSLDELHAAMQYWTGLQPRIPYPGPAITRDALARFLADFFEVLSATIGRTLVESSKRPRFGRLLMDETTAEIKVLHLVRDARAAVNSRLRRGIKKMGDASAARIAATVAADAIRWNVANRDTAALARSPHCIAASHLRYEDLCSDTPGETRRIASELGLSPTLSETSVETRDGELRVHLRREHVLWGNRGASAGWTSIVLDDTWPSEMKPSHRRLVETISRKGLRRYAYPV